MKDIYISNPCSENWDEMNTEGKGRFCSVCSKCVIDFTGNTKLEIQRIIEEKSDENICGRFYNHQLSTKDPNVFNIKEKFFRNIPAVFANNRILPGLFTLILFLTGCFKEKKSCVVNNDGIITKKDSTKRNNNFVLGEPLMQNYTVAKPSKKDSTSLRKK